MATTTAAHHPLTNGTSPSAAPIELALPMPHAPHMRIHIHLTILATTLILFVTTAGADSAGTAPMGSFVYAMPDRYNPSQPLSTALYHVPASVDFATRLAKVLARKTGKAVHVGSSASFQDAAQGGSVEEEMQGFRAVVEAVVAELEKTKA